MYNRYFQISSCYKRENKDLKKQEIVIVWNQIKWKGLISQYKKYLVMSPEDFNKKFAWKIKEWEYNLGLTNSNIEVWVEEMYDVHWIIDKLPTELN